MRYITVSYTHLDVYKRQDEFRFYKRELSATDVAELYQTNFRKNDAYNWNFTAPYVNIPWWKYTYWWTAKSIDWTQATVSRSVTIDDWVPSIRWTWWTIYLGYQTGSNFSGQIDITEGNLTNFLRARGGSETNYGDAYTGEYLSLIHISNIILW